MKTKLDYLALVGVLIVSTANASDSDHGSGGTTMTYELSTVRLSGDLRVCPGGHQPTGTGIEKSGCKGADPVTVENEVERRCPGAKLTGVTPQLTNTKPQGVRSVVLMVELPQAGCNR